MQASLDDIVKSLEVIRATQGEEAYLRARDSLAVMLINQPRGEEFLNMAFPGLDLEPIRQRAAEAEAQKKTAAPPNDMLALIRTHVPHLQTQAQLDTFMLAFNAFTLVFDSYFAGNFEAGDQARESLSKTLDLAHQVGQMGAQVNEIPPEARSDEASKFVEPPKQFTEADEKNQLMAELGSIMTKRGLNEWYQSERKRIDGVVSKRLRDELFDAIRAKDQSLLN
jgi:hypothetical protein